MLVYGDPQFKCALSRLLQRLIGRIDAARSCELEDLRPLLIQAGQLEQAVQDYRPEPIDEWGGLVWQFQQITDHAATAFHSVWRESSKQRAIGHRGAAESLATMRKEAQKLSGQANATLTVKVPEGFEFYALYPEQYCASALRWAAEHQAVKAKRAVVIGIRSIGTTLSALVLATLKKTGWQARRFTVRPAGDAFRRTARIERGDLGEAEWALVVDEGPGLSGSSMASVAGALVQANMPQERIVFLPGHAELPGTAASPDILQWWASTVRYFTPLSEAQWNGLSLTESLMAQAARLCPGAGSWEHIEDVGGGLWRRLHWPKEADWPAAVIPFERPKYRCLAGSGFSLLWKFIGLGAMTESGQGGKMPVSDQVVAGAKADCTPQPLGIFRGFVALPWIGGRPLTVADATKPGVVEHLGRYLAHAAGPPLSLENLDSASARLAQMLYWNTKESLGEAAAADAAAWGEKARGLVRAQEVDPTMFRSFGDGHLAPHEWLRDTGGRIWKTDCFGHDLDHTMVGQQSVAWDIAGAISEWQLNKRAQADLLTAITRAGVNIHLPFLFFHRLAYAAFRTGLTCLCAKSASIDRPDQRRLSQAHKSYRDELALLLKNSR